MHAAREPPGHPDGDGTGVGGASVVVDGHGSLHTPMHFSKSSAGHASMQAWRSSPVQPQVQCAGDGTGVGIGVGSGVGVGVGTGSGTGVGTGDWYDPLVTSESDVNPPRELFNQHSLLAVTWV